MPKRKKSSGRNNLINLHKKRKELMNSGGGENVTQSTDSSCSGVSAVSTIEAAVVDASGNSMGPTVERDAREELMVYGTIHQSSQCVSAGANGNMCTACALVALCIATHLPPSEWTSETLDILIKVGDQFYTKVVEMRRIYSPTSNHPHLTSDEVTHPTNNTFVISNFGKGFRCTQNYEMIQQGFLRARDGQMLPLREGLRDFFERSCRGVIVCGSQTMAIQKCVDEYCLIDSHSRPNFRGGHGTNAFLLRCPSIESLTEALLEIFQNREDRVPYTIDSIEIESASEEMLPPPDDSFRFTSEVFARPYNTRRRVDVRARPTVARRETARTRARARQNSAVSEVYLGEMDVACASCGALKFRLETNFGCCKDGQIDLPVQSDYPEYLRALLTGDHPQSKHFLENVRAYNSHVAMASVAANYHEPAGRGPPIIKISGIFHHRIGDVTRNNPQFGSVYICSGETDESCNNPQLSPGILREIRQLLRQRNPFVGVYRQMGEYIDGNDPVPDLHINFYLNPTVDRRRYNAPTDPNEVGAVFFSRDGQVPPTEANCLQVYYVDNAPERLFNNNVRTQLISKNSPISDPLCYPVLFPNGELGWAPGLALNSPRGRSRTTMTMREFSVYHVQVRLQRFTPALFAGKLTQHYFTDQWVKVEGGRLDYIRNNQTRLRAESYDGVIDYYRRRVDNDEHLNVGRVIILPSSFYGGQRYMIGTYQDSMAMVAKFGKPTFFITMTCNPRWKEVSENLAANQIPSNRPDLIVRVFHEKLKMLMAELTKDMIFGKVVSHVCVIEFQKRGLPHAHILLTVEENARPKSPEDIDRFVSCELPDPVQQKELYEKVLDMMVHGPCGDENPSAQCMVDGACKKKFPFAFAEKTTLHENAVTYRRRNTGSVEHKGRLIDNSWIIPYNPYLLQRYNCHINLLFVSDVKCVKYLYKYITKGHDAALFRVEEQRRNSADVVFDEICQFIESRYISACEAAWRLFGKPMYDKSHRVVRLPIHLANERTVYFRETDDPDVILNAADSSVSLLEEYFRLNGRDDFARTLYYVQIPEYYVFRDKAWHRRQRNVKVIGRIYSVNPRAVEKFHLRVLLLHVKGAVSFEDLLDPRDGDPTPCLTFCEAARRRMLIGGDDLEWTRTLEETVRTQVAGQCRKIFCYVLNFCDVVEPRALYDTFRLNLMEDYLRRGFSENDAEKKSLVRMERFLGYFNNSLRNYGMADLLARFDVGEALYLADNDDDDEQSRDGPDRGTDLEVEAVNRADLIAEVEEEVALFNARQRTVFDSIWESVSSEPFARNTPKCFYLQGAGGTGKTFLYNVLLKRSETAGYPFLAVAHTGIAALLLRKGRTAHSTFRLPLDVHEDTTSSITRGSAAGEILKRVRLIVWDEISMTNYFTVNTVDRLFRDLHANETTPFGGTCVLFGGDLRQLLPVNKRSNVQIQQTFMNCFAWSHFRVLELTENMRADRDALQFADWLLQLGNGTLRPDESIRHLLPGDSVQVPEECVSSDAVEDIYGDIFDMAEADRIAAFSERMVLCPLNDTCDAINDRLMRRHPGESVVVLSNDSIETDDVNDRIKYQEEVLNSRDHAGLPKHVLTLKVGVPIILLRNISMEDGLVNGTRMVVRSVSRLLLTAEIICGPRRGQTHTIPRMDLSSRDSHFPFTLKRRQFPVKLCFAMTVNKSQGQSFQRIGLYLPRPVFAFGQLYVAFSRSRSFSSVRVQVEDTSEQGRLIVGDERVFTRNMAPMELMARLNHQLNSN